MPKRSLSERKIKYIPPSKVATVTDTGLKRKKRAAAYCRVSTDSKEQETSFDSQVRYYTEKIEANKEWEFAGMGERNHYHPSWSKKIFRLRYCAVYRETQVEKGIYADNLSRQIRHGRLGCGC